MTCRNHRLSRCVAGADHRLAIVKDLESYFGRVRMRNTIIDFLVIVNRLRLLNDQQRRCLGKVAIQKLIKLAPCIAPNEHPGNDPNTDHYPHHKAQQSTLQ
ncbi:hypothetical protein AWB67_07609 [Caballeronia terrestris]|uniref:Uncharacterized protein n=1 Tax=Caballeronia terrestris TaxID=1226301 RepID=A0A158L654_9BURK|nr:hypothetical protein AWB67_07609 [Caballeronia terrestris]